MQGEAGKGQERPGEVKPSAVFLFYRGSNNNNTNTDTNTNTTTSNSSCRGGIGSGLSRCFCATAEGGDEVFEPGRRRIGGDTWL